MTNIEFVLGCRECLKARNFIHVLPKSDVESKTEFEICQYLENIYYSEGTHCVFCNSKCISITEIMYHGKKVYNYDDIEERHEIAFKIFIEGDDNSGFNVKCPNFTKMHKLKDLKQLKDKILEYIYIIPSERFNNKDNNYCFICVSVDIKDNDYKVIIHKLEHDGFEKETIIDVINGILYNEDD